MSLDLKAEEDLYKAIKQVAQLPWHSIKIRIFKESIETICQLAGWAVETKDLEPPA